MQRPMVEFELDCVPLEEIKPMNLFQRLMTCQASPEDLVKLSDILIVAEENGVDVS
jgi:hypothetical protein